MDVRDDQTVDHGVFSDGAGGFEGGFDVADRSGHDDQIFSRADGSRDQKIDVRRFQKVVLNLISDTDA